MAWSSAYLRCGNLPYRLGSNSLITLGKSFSLLIIEVEKDFFIYTLSYWPILVKINISFHLLFWRWKLGFFDTEEFRISAFLLWIAFRILLWLLWLFFVKEVAEYYMYFSHCIISFFVTLMTYEVDSSLTYCARHITYHGNQTVYLIPSLT